MLELRHLTTDDVPAWAALLNAGAVADRTGVLYSEEDLVEELENPGIDPALDTIAAVDDGVLVGAGQLIPIDGDGSVHTLHLDGMTHPDHRGRGIGTAVLGALVDRAEAIRGERFAGAPRAWRIDVLEADAAAVDLIRQAGFTPERWTVDMRVDLTSMDDTPVGAVTGLQLRSYDPDTDEDALRHAHNDAFRDHPNSITWSSEMWAQHVTGSRSFRPSLTSVAVDPDRPEDIQAYVQASEYDGFAAHTGRRELWIARVGTRRAHRGRGVAAALLRRTMALAQAEGFDEAALDVDQTNPTGALGLYERNGFVVERRWVNAFRRD